MKLTAAQQTISNCSSRFRVVAAGRRFGKSFLSLNEIAKFARHPNQRVLYVAPTYRQAKTVIWDEMKTQFTQRRWVKKINESDLSVRLVNNSLITIRSSDNYDSLRGGKYDFIVLDECADIDPQAWFSVLRPTLSDTGGHALFIGSPKGRNYFYDLWLQAGAVDDWSSFQYTTLDGGNVPPEEVEAAKRDMDQRTFEQEYLAQFVNYAGVIFYALSEENIQQHPGIDEHTALHIGMDFNVTPCTAAIATRTPDGLHFFDEIVLHSSNTNEMAEEIRRRYGYGRQIYVYPDSSGGQRRTSANGITDHVILHNAGFKVVVDSINPPVNDSIASVNGLLCSTNGERRLLLDPKCKHIRESMLKWTYKEDSRIPDKSSGWDHMCDCIRYIVQKLYPIQMNIKASALPSVRGAGRLR